MRAGLFGGIKYIPLDDADPDTYLSIGGEVRLRAESYRPPEFGLTDVNRNDYLLSRVELHADVHWTKHVRFFTELISGGSLGEDLPAPPSQQNDLDLQQAFADFDFGASASAQWRVRAGRMEMGLGSNRLVAPREGTNIRFNYDGIRLGVRDDARSLDVFVTRPVEQATGTFDDSADEERLFYGLYGVAPLLSEGRLALDAYYFGFRRENASFGEATGMEDRQTTGLRLWGKPGRWDFDYETVYQFGDFDEQDIRAWTFASNTGVRLGTDPDAMRLGLKANVASGDHDADDAQLGTFNALFPRNNYFSEAVLFAPANFYDVQPTLQITPAANTLVTASCDAFFRYSKNDAVYAPGHVAIPAGASDGSYVGTTGSVQLDWTPAPHTTASFAYVHLWAGDVVRDADGSDVDFLLVSLSYRF